MGNDEIRLNEKELAIKEYGDVLFTTAFVATHIKLEQEMLKTRSRKKAEKDARKVATYCLNELIKEIAKNHGYLDEEAKDGKRS